MAEDAERTFAKTFLNMLSTQSITYSDDYQQPPELSLRKVPVLPIAVPPPPEREPQLQPSGSSSASISLVFKSLKPQATFTISVRPTDTISAIKTQLSAEPSAPPAEAQRILFKGKALADGKLLKEYNNIKDGDTINLMVKPGYDWNTTARSGVGEKGIILTIDPGVLPSPVLQPGTMSTYHHTLSRPEFWERLHDFLKNEFRTPEDVHSAFENFLCAAEGSLTASEVAKIRDQVGVIGLAA